MSSLEERIRSWDGEAVVSHFDRPTQSWIFIAIHSSLSGMPVGGTRIRVYPSPADGLEDAMRLAEGMTHKWACLGVAKGGGKAVLAVPTIPEGTDRVGLLQRYGNLVESLRGAFGTGEDLGTTPEDMAVIGTRTRYVHGRQGDGSVTDPGPFTAAGVASGIRAAVRHAFGSEELAGRRILVQGVGDVGLPLARTLAQAGAELLICDADARRASQVAEELGASSIPADQAYASPCDVFAPCAVGAVLNADTIPRLGCRIVAGSANNQLATPEDAQRLHERGILYAPDYVINAGGALAFALLADGEEDLEILMGRMERVGRTVGEILQEGAATQASPLTAARQRVEKVLEEARKRRQATPL